MNSPAEQTNLVLRIVRIVGFLLCLCGITLVLGGAFIKDFITFDDQERIVLGGALLLMGLGDLMIVPRLLEKAKNSEKTSRNENR